MDVRSEPETPRREVYEDLRPLLFSIAYRIVSSVSEAEDIVQEAFLRFHRAQSEGADIDSPQTWLSTVTTRLAINQVRSARARRETHVGTWLPEPLLTDPASDSSVHAETADSLSMAFLVLLESLSPVERAVFLLREVFDYGYDEIAAVVGRSEENCRQIAVRARRQVEAKKPRFEASRMYYLNVMAGPTERAWRVCPDPAHEWLAEFLEAAGPDPRCPVTTSEGPRIPDA
jgi:RNA polymerase sigma-70 factor (ECF subfamily)